MRTPRHPLLITALSGALALALFPACGGSGDDDNAADAATSNPDAAESQPDAPPAETGFGQVCDNTNMCPTTGATDCVAISSGATHGWCTLECGTTQDTTAGPAGGDDICAAAYSGTVPDEGTPGCVIYSGTAAPYTWSCAILCGTYMTTNLGGCPTGLTCNTAQNICE